jgi:hypothetical protein
MIPQPPSQEDDGQDEGISEDIDEDGDEADSGEEEAALLDIPPFE